MSNLHLPDIESHTSALRVLGNKSARKIGYKTLLVQEAGCIAVFHHSTPIIRYYPDGSITLNNGGWASSTTAQRMHRLTPLNVRVFIKQYEMFVQVDGGVLGHLGLGPITIHP